MKVKVGGGAEKWKMEKEGRDTQVKTRLCWHMVVMNPQQKLETSFTSNMAQSSIGVCSEAEVRMGHYTWGTDRKKS